jgi:hypothetical protein
MGQKNGWGAKWRSHNPQMFKQRKTPTVEMGKKNVRAKNQAAAQTLFIQFVCLLSFCPSIFLPLSLPLPVMQSRFHPDSADSLQLSFDGPLSAFQFAGNFGVRGPLKLEQHDFLHCFVW